MKRRGKAIKLRAKVARRVAAAKVRLARPPAKARPAPATDLRRELDAALGQLAATSEVLQVISSSPGELQPVFQLILKNATRICEAKFGNLWLREGDKFRIVANYGGSREYRDFQLRNSLTIPDPRTAIGRAIITRKGVQIDDIRKAPIYGMKAREATIKIAKARTLVAVPMLKSDEVIGAIGIYRQEVRPFTDKQVALLTTFAAQAVIAIENTRLLTELRRRTTDLTESLEQQTATSEVLRVISSSAGDLEPVFSTVLGNASRICEANFGILSLREGDASRVVALHNAPPAFAELRRREPVIRVGPLSLLAATKRWVQISDLTEQPAYKRGDRDVAAFIKLTGARTLLAVPMLKDDELIGAIAVYRTEVRAFTDKQIELMQSFAAQAVIAIENARLLGELRESLEQQTAMSDVLRVISSTPGELEPVFRAMLESATRICEAKFGLLFRYDGEMLEFVADMGTSPALAEFVRQRGPFRPNPNTLLARVIRTKKVSETQDYAADAPNSPPVKFGGARSTVDVPLLKDDELVGALSIYRQEVRPFTDKQIALVENFAAQAVIAIENARLLNELRQRTRELTESLEQQKATSEVLSVISRSPGDLNPVFDAILANATRICEASFGNLELQQEDGTFRLGAAYNAPAAFAEQRRLAPIIRPHPQSSLARVVATKKFYQIEDLAEHPLYKEGSRLPKEGRFLPYVDLVDKAKARSFLVVPLLKDDELVGVLGIYRQEVRSFTDKQIALVENFAAQAVIAIENARLLGELRELLERQTATSEVLGVISRSKFELQPILQSVVDTAERLCRAEQTVIYRLEDGVYRFAAGHSAVPAYLELERNTVISPGPGTVIGRAAITRQIARIDDAWNDPLYEKKEDAKVGGVRSMIGVPLMRDGEPIGVIGLARCRVEPFSDREIELVATFADQAVIAIENVRLFEAEQRRTRELTESLEQQTATSEVLRVISSSPSELGPVFQTMLANATRLCEANFGTLNLYKDGTFPVVAMHDVPPEYAEFRRLNPQFRVVDGHPLGRVAATGQVQQIFDMRLEPLYLEKDPSFVAMVERAGARTLFLVPMLKDDDVIGVITIFRQEVRPFTDKQIALVQNFAAQAVIAIENTRLLNELRQRTDDLTESLEQQTATSEVLQVIQFVARRS